MRPFQDEETIDLKDNLRAMVRKELESLELKHRDMASLLRALGIHVRGGSYPMSGEVNDFLFFFFSVVPQRNGLVQLFSWHQGEVNLKDTPLYFFFSNF